MISRNDSSARTEAMGARRRQQQIGRELRLFYERLLREPLPQDMINTLREADQRRQDNPSAKWSLTTEDSNDTK